jgi:nicotinamide-nucleotide amidase
VQRKINCFGAGESAIEEKVADLTRRDHVPEVGITVSDAVISLRILARAAATGEAQTQIEPVERTIRERLGDLVFGVENEDLEDAVVPLLAARRLTIATAESITAGQVAARLGRIAGVSAWLHGGIVAYHNDVKINSLGVPAEMIREHGAVSSQVAEAMAIGCRQRLGVDLAVSTTGIAGPGGATETKPVGLVYVGLAHAGGTRSLKWNWAGTRTEVQSRSARHALNLVRLHLLKSK